MSGCWLLTAKFHSLAVQSSEAVSSSWRQCLSSGATGEDGDVERELVMILVMIYHSGKVGLLPAC